MVRRRLRSAKEDALNPQQLSSLITILNTLRDKVIVYTMLYGGLRVSELCHMRRHWLNFETGTLSIPAYQECDCAECQKYRQGVWRPKTEKGVREIVIHPTLLPILQEFFSGNQKLGLTRQRVWQRIKDLARQATILHNTYPHCLRGTAATLMANRRMSAPGMMYIFGWSRVASAESYIQSNKYLAQKEQHEIYSQK